MKNRSDNGKAQLSFKWVLAYAERPEYSFDEVKEAVWDYDRKLRSLGMYTLDNHLYLFRGQNVLFLDDVYRQSKLKKYAEKTTAYHPVAALRLRGDARHGLQSMIDRRYKKHRVTADDRVTLDELIGKAQRLALALQGTLCIRYGAGYRLLDDQPDDLLAQAGVQDFNDIVF